MASMISVGQVLDTSIEHCRKHFKELLAITLWMVIASIPTVLGKILAPTGGESSTLNGGDWLTFSLSILGIILVAVISIWMYATLTLAVSEQATGRRIDLKAIYRKGWKVFFPYLLLTLLITAIILGLVLVALPGYVLLIWSSASDASPALAAIGTPLFLIGAVFALILIIKYSVMLAFAPYVLLLEKRSPVAAVKGSIALVNGRWWATAVRFALPKLVYFLVFFVANYIIVSALQLLMGFLVDTSPVLVIALYTFSLLLSVFLSAIVTPLLIATDYYLYDSLRKTR